MTPELGAMDLSLRPARSPSAPLAGRTRAALAPFRAFSGVVANRTGSFPPLRSSPPTLSRCACRSNKDFSPRSVKFGSSFLGHRVDFKPQCVTPGAKSRQGHKFQISAQTVKVIDTGRSLVSSFVDFFRSLIGSTDKQMEVFTGLETDEFTPEKTCLVVGGTGKTGKYIVQYLVQRGYKAIVLASSEDRVNEVLVEELKLKIGRNEGGGSLVFALGNILDENSLRTAIQGCGSVICCVNSKFSASGYLPGSSPEDIFGQGIPTLIQTASELLSDQDFSEKETTIFDFTTLGSESSPIESETGASEPKVVDGWIRMDDVIMGGISESRLRVDGGFAVFEGILRAEGGGFCSTKTQLPNSPLDLSNYDGIKLRVKGDGQRYKLNLRTSNVDQIVEFSYQVSFDTVKGRWLDVHIPFDSFKGVKRSRVIEDAPPIQKESITSMALVLSRFQVDELPNPLCKPGNFKLEVQKISAYKAVRPRFVLVSSAAVERNARIKNEQMREYSIPIVKLNPGGVLSWKMVAEDTLRASGIPYTIVRPCGLTEKDENEPFLLEVSQGDCITGLISRKETADVIVRALESPYSTNTTFEVRRDELTKGLSMSDVSEVFLRLRPDVLPSFVYYPPIPKGVTQPEPSPKDERVEEKENGTPVNDTA